MSTKKETHDDPIAVWETIDAPMALRYLETSLGNRPISMAIVNDYLSQIRCGIFAQTHQGIGFDKKNHLRDGHHRLWAVAETATPDNPKGIPVRIMVTRGLSEEACAHLDRGKTRSVQDQAHFDGLEIDKLAWGVAKMLVRGPTTANVSIPYVVLRDWYNFYREGIDQALQWRAGCRPAQRRMSLPMTVPFVRAYYHFEDRGRLERMLEVIRNGVAINESESAAIALRDAWLSGRLGTNASDQYFKTESAIRSFMEARSMRNLQRVTAELFLVAKLPAKLVYRVEKAQGRWKEGAPAAASKLNKKNAPEVETRDTARTTEYA